MEEERETENQSLFFFFSLLQLHLQHMEVPGLGVRIGAAAEAYATTMATPDPSLICDYKAKNQTCILMDTISGS